MSELYEADGIQIEQDLRLRRREWAFQRAGRIGMTLLLAVAATGLLGQGPLSHQESALPDGALRAEFERFSHFQSPAEIRLHLGQGAVREGEARVWISREYLEANELTGIVPAPVRAEAGPDRTTYVWAAPENAPTAVTFRLQPQSIGKLKGAIGVPGGGALELSQLVYP